jgi:choline dehydrogenase-like flavoprotein
LIRDLTGSGAISHSCDILIIGAGTAGLVMAYTLARQGQHVICLESGGRHQDSDTHELNAVEQLGTPYAGAEHGRFRCLGGTSTRWGGALIPFQSADLVHGNWPMSAGDLAQYAAKVEALFGLPAGPYDEAVLPLTSSHHVGRSAKWPPFSNRNVYNLLKDSLDGANGPDIWLNATATDFSFLPGNARRVTAHAPDGGRIEVNAPTVVLAAGAIESTRLLLLADRQNGYPIAATTDTLGRYFHDHLSAPVADLAVTDRTALNRIAGFRFGPGGAMRNLRFELAENSELRMHIPPCFAHIAFREGDNAFSDLRKVYQALQRRTAPSPAALLGLARGLPWLARAAWWRFAEKRLLYPADVGVEIHMVIEQQPVAENRLTLSADSADRFGAPRAAIDWAVSDEDVAAMLAAASAFAATWVGSPLAQVAHMTPRPQADIARAMREGGGIYHPGGSTRMAAHASDGVVDRDLQVFAMPGVHVVATSVLPTGGGANPTMMLMMLALRCADRLAKARPIA